MEPDLTTQDCFCDPNLTEDTGQNCGKDGDPTLLSPHCSSLHFEKFKINSSLDISITLLYFLQVMNTNLLIGILNKVLAKKQIPLMNYPLYQCEVTFFASPD